MKKKTFVAVMVCGLVLTAAAPVSAHVTVQPNEVEVGSFSRFVVRVPTERDVPTTEVRVEFPPLAFVSFQPKPGWERDVEMTELDEPLNVFGNEITEVVGSVTWSGGRIGPGEFDEFGFSARTPDDETTLEFAAFQTYANGEVVEWTGPPDSDEPAATLDVIDVGADQDEGRLAVLADVRERVDHVEQETHSLAEQNEGAGNLGVILGAAGVVLGAVALAVATRGRRSKG